MKRFSESGPAYADDFTFDDFKAKDLQFFVAKNGLEEFGIDGVVGMEYKTTKATDNNYTGFFETLIQQNAVHTNEFSFFFGRENIEEDELTLGGRDPAKFSGKFTTAPVTGMGDGWRIQLEGVAVNEKPVSCVAPQTSMSHWLIHLHFLANLYESIHRHRDLSHKRQHNHRRRHP